MALCFQAGSGCDYALSKLDILLSVGRLICFRRMLFLLFSVSANRSIAATEEQEILCRVGRVSSTPLWRLSGTSSFPTVNECHIPLNDLVCSSVCVCSFLGGCESHFLVWCKHPSVVRWEWLLWDAIHVSRAEKAKGFWIGEKKQLGVSISTLLRTAELTWLKRAECLQECYHWRKLQWY